MVQKQNVITKYNRWLSLMAIILIIMIIAIYITRLTEFLPKDDQRVIEPPVSLVTADSNSVFDIIEVPYHMEGIDASYPKIISGASAEEREEWNKIIKEDFDKILQIYSFQPFPSPTPGSNDVMPSLLLLSYELKSNTEGWLSILYHAYYSSAYSAHPSNLIYTTNIDKEGRRRLRLSDILDLNKDFIEEFGSWKRKEVVGEASELDSAIQDYVDHISDEELLDGFQKADQIGSDNPWGIYSYLKQDGLGISLEVPHYAGDHAEFEQTFALLKNYLKPEFASMLTSISK